MTWLTVDMLRLQFIFMVVGDIVTQPYSQEFLFPLLDPNDFTVQDATSEESFDMKLVTSIQRARRRPLLQVIFSLFVL